MKKFAALIAILLVGILALAACAPAAAPEPTEAPVVTEAPTEVTTEAPAPAWTAPEGALVAVPVAEAPTLDGDASDAVWADAAEIAIPVSGGMNLDGGETTINLKAVYTADSVYFLATWEDPTESFFRSPWEKQADGTWKKVSDPNDKGGDNNTVYEDKMAIIWPINNSIEGFDKSGCFVVCHAGENSDIKPFGNKYTAGEGQLGDIWHWKSIRDLNQMDDQYLDWTKLDVNDLEKTKEAGRHSDAKDSGGYADNVNEAKDGPAYTSPSIDPKTGAPGYILDSEKVEIDPAAINAGEFIPGIVKSELVGDRGDIKAGWKYADGKWTLEFGRALTTGSETDVQFSDLTALYNFAMAIFDNAQVRHAYETGVSILVFQPK